MTTDFVMLNEFVMMSEFVMLNAAVILSTFPLLQAGVSVNFAKYLKHNFHRFFTPFRMTKAQLINSKYQIENRK